jgi:hypothetical protein
MGIGSTISAIPQYCDHTRDLKSVGAIGQNLKKTEAR